MNNLKTQMASSIEKQLAVFPCRFHILSPHIFHDCGINFIDIIIDEGMLKQNTPLVALVGDMLIDIGTVNTMTADNMSVQCATHSEKVRIGIDISRGDKKMFGRRFDHTTPIVSKITRQSIDACKTHFRNDLSKDDWRLMKTLKEDIFCFH